MSKLACDCGSITYYTSKITYTEDGNRFAVCNECSNYNAGNLCPDVFFDSSKGANQTDPNLCDRKTGPISFSSKREKAAILKRLQLREAGDREHGSRNFDKTASKQWDNFK